MTAPIASPVQPGCAATSPPEARGLARDGVRLMVARARHAPRHLRFTGLPGALRPGDLLVVNTSATEPAAVDGHRYDGRAAVLHVSGPTPTSGPEEFVVELRTPDGHRVHDAVAGERLRLPRGHHATLRTGHPDADRRSGGRLWLARLPGGRATLAAVGRPIRYAYVQSRWPLAAYQTLFARAEDGFGSAEMPSAARPFSAAVVAALIARGVRITGLSLHTGVSSLEAGELPLPERYRVPVGTAAAVNRTRAGGGRVIAVGTTVTRALETLTDAAGRVRPGAGWTDLVLSPERPARAVDGLLTGWHEPAASHRSLLAAVAGPPLLQRAEAAAAEHGYLCHEFGDSCLLLP